VPRTRLAVHPMVVAVAMGLLAPQSLTELVDGSEPELGPDADVDLAFLADDGGLRFEADPSVACMTAPTLGAELGIPVRAIDPDDFARVEALWKQTT
jgi:hypothetical protein